MYTLRFPFEVTAERVISDLPQELALGPYHANLDADGNGYVLTVSGLPDEATARSCDGQVRLALYWLLLEYDLAAKPVPPLRDVQYTDDPAGTARHVKESWGVDFGESIDGVADGNCPAVYRTEQNIRTLTGKTATVTVGRNGESVVAGLAESAQRFPAATADDLAAAVPDNRLETALDLYGAHISEHSVRAQFLTLMMAMEALCEPEKRPPEVRTLLKHFATRITEMKDAPATGPESRAVLESLQREVDFRTGDSIRNQMRRLIRATLAGEDDVEDVTGEMVALYDKRSTLIHTGTLPRQELGDAVPRARAIARRVLRARLEAALGTRS
ncbi:MAG: hypothetical protein FKY71_07710 [Spiribacter salinus]|uniref:Uncharacterized protein n=1 Tax=Spiribacter salinus TaxID=1335746 RepID=A0A540VS59_9GAMM|nr:MAG: hypothetical protein FKY71_07710 [Spiribacter salinus]